MDDRREDATETFRRHRGQLNAVAYRILGSVVDAEDVVQEAWLRWSRSDGTAVRDPRAFLVRVTTRHAIDRLRRLKARRESYVGPWLPEPMVTEHDPADDVVMADSISMAMLVVLETLSPLERAVFVLREAFGMTHAEIAEILERTEDAVRQLARRAREHVGQGAVRYAADRPTHEAVTARFLAATADGDLQALMRVLAPEVVLVADGGGRTLAPRRPLHGAEKVARFLLAAVTPRGTARFLESVMDGPAPDTVLRVVDINGRPGVVVTADGRGVAALAIDVDGDTVAGLYLVANPEKLDGVHDARPGW